MKKSELLFNLISIIVDFLMLLLAGIIAFYLRFELGDLRPILYSLSIYDYLKVLFLVSPVLLVILAFAGLYNLKGTRRTSAELLKIVLAISSGLLLVVILFFFNQSVFPSRLIILFTWLLTIVLISIGRIILRAIQIRQLQRGVGVHKLIVIAPDKSVDLVSEIEKRKELGFKIVAKLVAGENSELLIAEISRIKNEQGIDELLVADPMLDQRVSQDLLNYCRDYSIKFNFVPNLFETATTNIAVETISGIPIIVLKRTPLEGWGSVLKRIVDIIISLVGLIILSPIFLLISILI